MPVLSKEDQIRVARL